MGMTVMFCSVMKARKAILMLGLLVFTSFADAQSSIIIQVRVKAESVNVRAMPNVQSNIVGKLSKSDVLVAAMDRSGWLMVQNGEGYGYISAKHVEVMQVLSGGSDEECEADWSNVDLDYSIDSFKCSEDLLSEGYEKCELYINIFAESSCATDYGVSGSCDVAYKVTEAGDAISFGSRSEFHSFFFYANNGSGNTYELISWKPNRILETVVGVKIANISCSVSAVYD